MGTPKQPDLDLYAEYLKSIADRALVPAEVRSDVPLRFYPEVDDYTMSMGMDVTPGGRIWLGWFAGGDDDRAVIVLAKSDDKGKTFSRPQFILDPGYTDTGIHLSAVVGNLWTAPDGRLFLFYTQSLGYFDGRAGSWFAVCENPDSDKPVWSKPQRIWHGTSLNKPTVLRDGTWLLPVVLWTHRAMRIEASSLWCNMGGRLFPELDPLRMTHVFASNDQGRTWTDRGCAKNPDDIFDESMILERKDGSLLMYMRTCSGIAECESTDGGRTWSEPRKRPEKSACARFFLRKLRSGRTLLVRNANPNEPAVRSHMTAFLSDDDGRTWLGGLLLDANDGSESPHGGPDSGVSYPDGFQTDDGTICIQYDYQRQSGEIRMAKFREEDVLAGKDVSGCVELKQPCIQSNTMRMIYSRMK